MLANTPHKEAQRKEPARPKPEKETQRKELAKPKPHKEAVANKQSWGLPLFNPKCSTTQDKLRRCELTASTVSQARVHIFTLHEHCYGSLFENRTGRVAQAIREQKLTKNQALEMRSALLAQR